MGDPQHPEHDAIAEWARQVAGPWVSLDPTSFDADIVNGEIGGRFESGLGMSGVPTDVFPGDPKSPAGRLAAAPVMPQYAAIIDILERLPVPLRINLRSLLRHSGALKPVEIDPETAAAMVEPYRWLVRRAGTDGIRLTRAGWLPPAVVSAAMEDLGWHDRWIGMGNREDLTLPVLKLRENATKLGLVRKRNGELHATATARKRVNDPVVLLRMLADAVVRSTNSQAGHDAAVLIALGAALTDPDDPDAVAYDAGTVRLGLDELGWTSADGSPLRLEVTEQLTRDTLALLESLGVFDERDQARVTDGGRAFAREMLRSLVE